MRPLIDVALNQRLTEKRTFTFSSWRLVEGGLHVDDRFTPGKDLGWIGPRV